MSSRVGGGGSECVRGAKRDRNREYNRDECERRRVHQRETDGERVPYESAKQDSERYAGDDARDCEECGLRRSHLSPYARYG
jgi:hypothetical protein